MSRRAPFWCAIFEVATNQRETLNSPLRTYRGSVSGKMPCLGYRRRYQRRQTLRLLFRPSSIQRMTHDTCPND